MNEDGVDLVASLGLPECDWSWTPEGLFEGGQFVGSHSHGDHTSTCDADLGPRDVVNRHLTICRPDNKAFRFITLSAALDQANIYCLRLVSQVVYIFTIFNNNSSRTGVSPKFLIFAEQILKILVKLQLWSNIKTVTRVYYILTT